MVDYILEYRTGNLIIIYHYIYSRLSDTAVDVIWNSIELMRNIRSGPWINGWLEWSTIYAGRMESMWITDGI